MANQKKQETVKEIPAKNYLVLGVIVVITLLVCIYLFAWFRQYNDSKINTPVITSTLRQVEYNNLNTVVKERDMILVYMCTTDESLCGRFEKKFASYVKDNNLTEEIIYLNLGYNSDENNLLKDVYNKYKSNTLVKKVHKYPTLLIFNEGKIVDVLSSSSKHKLTIKQVDQFLEGYEL